MWLIGKSSENNAKVPTRASLRRVLLSVLRSDADLQAFCLDRFPDIAARFGDNMDRLVKLNLLLGNVPTEEVLAALKEANGVAVARNEHLIVLGDGNDALPTSLLDARERRNRQRLIEKVRKFWIEGVLEKSLHGAVLIELGKEYRPDAVAYAMIIYNDPHKEVVVNATARRNGVNVGTLCDGIHGSRWVGHEAT